MIETNYRYPSYSGNRLIACNLKFYFGPSSAYRLDDLFGPEFFVQHYLSVEKQRYRRRVRMGEMVDEYPELETTARVPTTSTGGGCSALEVEQAAECGQPTNALPAERFHPPTSIAPLAPLSADQVHSMIDDLFMKSTDEKIQLVATSQYLSMDARFSDLHANDDCEFAAGGSCVQCDNASSTSSLVDASSQPPPDQLARRESSMTVSSGRSMVATQDCCGAFQLEPATTVSLSTGGSVSSGEEVTFDCESMSASTWKSAPNQQQSASSVGSSPGRTGKLLSSLRMVSESLARDRSSSPVEAGIMIWHLKDDRQPDRPRSKCCAPAAGVESTARVYSADCVGDWQANRPKRTPQRKTVAKGKGPEQPSEVPLWIGGLKRIDALTGVTTKVAPKGRTGSVVKPTKRNAKAPRWSLGRQLCKRCCPSDCVDALKSVYKRLRMV